MSNKAFIIIYLITIVSLLVVCCSDHYHCGDGYFYCDEIISTSSHGQPLSIDKDLRYVLLEGNKVAILDNTRDYSPIIDLNDVSPNDTIIDVVFTRVYWFLIYRSKCVSCYLIDWHGNYHVDFEFGNFGDSTDIINAVAAAADDANNIYIVDSGDNTIKIYNIMGEFISTWANVGEPMGINIREDEIYILDGSDHKIREYNSNCEYQETIFEDFEFYDIIAFDGFVVADHGGERLVIMSDPPEIKSNYCFMDAVIELHSVSDIYMSEGQLFWVVDSGANALIIFAPESYYYH